MSSPVRPEPEPGLLARARRLLGMKAAETPAPYVPGQPYVPPSGLVDTLSEIARRRPKAVGVSKDLGPGVFGEYRTHARNGQVHDTVFQTNRPALEAYFDASRPESPSSAHWEKRMGHRLEPDDILAHEFGHVADFNPNNNLPADRWGIQGEEEFADEFAKATRNLRAGREVVPSRIPLKWMQQQASRTYEGNTIRSLLGAQQIPRR